MGSPRPVTDIGPTLGLAEPVSTQTVMRPAGSRAGATRPPVRAGSTARWIEPPPAPSPDTAAQACPPWADTHAVAPGVAPDGGQPRVFELSFSDTIVHAQAGCPTACRELYESIAGRVCGYLRLHGAAEPDDLTSEVFLRVFTHLQDFSGDEPGFRAWVFTVAHHVLIDENRRRGRRPQLVEFSTPASDTPSDHDTEADALNAIEDADISRTLAGLAPDQRAVLTLRVVADLSIEQVAQVLGKRPGAIKALQHRGVTQLRRQLEERTA